MGRFIHNGVWSIPETLKEQLPTVAASIEEIEISDATNDEAVWVGSADGDLTIKMAWEYYIEKEVKVKWMKGLWRTFLPLKISVTSWKTVMNRMPTAKSLARVGMAVPPVCLVCIVGDEETVLHLFRDCPLAKW